MIRIRKKKKILVCTKGNELDGDQSISEYDSQ